jgi:hypothetical protein
MTMRPRSASGKAVKKKHGDAHVAVVGPHEVVRAALEWQVFLASTVHGSLGVDGEYGIPQG